MLKHGLTIFSLTNSDYLSERTANRAGGSERQLLYTAVATHAEGADVELVTVNLEGNPSSMLEGILVKNLWSTKANCLSKIFNMTRSLIGAKKVIYIRGISLVHTMIIIVSRMFGRRVLLGMTSDVQCAKNSSAFENIVKSLAIKFSTKVIAQTKKQQNLIDTHFSKYSVVFYNVIHSQLFGHAQPFQEFLNRDIDVLWLGTIEPKKGLGRLLDIAGQMPDKAFTVIGDSSLNSVDYATKIVSQLEIRPNISYEGFVQPSNIGSYIKRAKLLINTSISLGSDLTKEGFPNVFLEAWLFGTPVISMSIDLDGLISSKELGVFSKTIQESQKEIEVILGDQNRWELMSRNGRDFAGSRDAANKSVRKLLVDLMEIQAK